MFNFLFIIYPFIQNSIYLTLDKVTDYFCNNRKYYVKIN